METNSSPKYTIDDIQIFIATHNRADFLKESIQSILNQTAGVKHITVLDNESTDNTEEVVKSYADKGVEYVKTEGFLGNFYKAKELVNKPYCMVFHDDDILHPEYLEFAVELLNKYENVSLITTKYKWFFDSKIPKIKKIPKKDYYLFPSQNEYAKYMYFIEQIAYASAIYRSKEFKIHDLEYNKFCKFNDWPFMLKFTRTGNSVLVSEPMIYARMHKGQDSLTYKNVLSIEQCVNWVKMFNDIFEENKDYEALKYARQKNYRFLKGGYISWLNPKIKNSITLKEFLDTADDMGLHNFSRIRHKHPKGYNNYCRNIVKSNFVSHKNIFLQALQYTLNLNLDLCICTKKIKSIKNRLLILTVINFHNIKTNFCRRKNNAK